MQCMFFLLNHDSARAAAPDGAVCGYASMTALPPSVVYPHEFTQNSTFSSVL